MAELTHIGEDGNARMVGIADKAVTLREARAEGRITMSAEALRAIRDGDIKKGDVLGTARLAGIMAAKRTSDLIPLCHPLLLEKVAVDFAFESAGVKATAAVSLSGKTGAEIEALSAVTVALLTIYDMAKAVDKSMVISGVRLIAKSGGKSGGYRVSE